MSPVGHSLTGLSLAVLAIPSGATLRVRLLLPVVFVALANLPDWPIPGWGHDRYDISHSLFVNLALVTAVWVLWGMTRLKQKLSGRLVALGLTAWLSHILLDSFYGHGYGIAIFWPFSEGRLSLPINIFNTIDQDLPLSSVRNLRVYGIELLAYTPLLLFACLIRYRTRTDPPASP